MGDLQKYKPLLYNNPLCGIDTYKDVLTLATGNCIRRIKKLVLDGTENYGTSGSNTWLILGTSSVDFRGTADGAVCSHVPLVLRSNFATNTCAWGGGQIGDFLINIDNKSVENLKTYIAQQYASGTPVTVWYVLVAPTTETIIVPSGLSGTEEGYLSQDGTPTPINPIYPTANEVLIWQSSIRKLTSNGWVDASVKEWDGSQWNE